MENVKISLISLGCDKNLMDSEVMIGLIKEEGYILTSDENDADIVIINSCGFIMDANEESIENILRTADLKTNGKLKGIIVTGCMAQRYKEEIFKSLPETDAIVGTGDFEKIGGVIKAIMSGEKHVKAIDDKNKKIDEKNALKREISTAGFSYLKIAEGCDNFCTYCTIPYLRGKYRSRTMESLIKEAEALKNAGAKEIIIIAQDTSMYGTDLYGEKKLPELLRKISNIDGIEWIRILYCYPENITGELIDEIIENPKICNYLDMPVQHADDEILRRMGRKSTKKGLLDVIEKIRKKAPDFCFRTTLITGFPGETEENFNNLINFIKKVKFDRLGVFTYSREENTPAYKMKNQIDEETKNKRKDYIMELQKAISAERCEGFIGKTLKVIVEGKIENEEDVFCGRSYRDCYEIDGFVFFKGEGEFIAGDFVSVKITGASDYDLIGVIDYESAQ